MHLMAYPCYKLGGNLLTALLTEDDEERKGRTAMVNLPPSSYRFNGITLVQAKKLGALIVFGLEAFVFVLGQRTNDWPFDRNPLTHNEKLLDALFPNLTAGAVFDNDLLTDEIVAGIRSDVASRLDHNNLDMTGESIDKAFAKLAGTVNGIKSLNLYDIDELKQKVYDFALELSAKRR